MNLERIEIAAGDRHVIPGFLLAPPAAVGGALLLHPYGSTKEHMLGLAANLAEVGWAALAVDLCGHGQNSAPIGATMAEEVESALAYLRHYGRTAAVGISLGGRLVLTCSADTLVAISPAVVAEVSDKGRWMFENFPAPGVREPYAGYAVQLLQELGPIPGHARRCLVLYAERDIPNILEGASGLRRLFPNAEFRYITQDQRPDVQHESAFIRYLPRWFNHVELKFNLEVLRSTALWLGQDHGAFASGKG